jgi:uroporphyrinogen-III synthase
MTPDRPLANVGVLVTRPAAQAADFMARLEALGATPLLFPALAILPTSRPEALEVVLDKLDRYDLAIFISPTAAERGLAAVGIWPAGVKVAAVGQGTGNALLGAGVPAVLTPEQGADSEHLLALPELGALEGMRIVIFRGEGGRELLADTLRARGAQVDYAECYRRGRPESDPAPVLAALADARIQAVTVFSGETLDNLLALLGRSCQATLSSLPLFVPHPRIAEHGLKLGFQFIVTTGSGESGLIAGLVEYFAHDGNPP